jgi:hypothetical protein
MAVDQTTQSESARLAASKEQTSRAAVRRRRDAE